MNMDFTVLYAGLVGYLLGSISFSRLVLRLVAPKQDIADLEVPIVGTDETAKMTIIGASTASMILGPKWGLLIALFDMLKVVLPMFAFRIFYAEHPYFLLVSVVGVIGHTWPIYHRFKGGRGFSVLLISVIMVDWLGALVTLLLAILLGMVIIRNLWTVFPGWLLLMIPWMWFRFSDPTYLAYAIGVNAVFFLASVPEMKMVLRYRREGKLDGYLNGLYKSSAMWRGMKKLFDRLQFRKKSGSKE